MDNNKKTDSAHYYRDEWRNDSKRPNTFRFLTSTRFHCQKNWTNKTVGYEYQSLRYKFV